MRSGFWQQATFTLPRFNAACSEERTSFFYRPKGILWSDLRADRKCIQFCFAAHKHRAKIEGLYRKDIPEIPAEAIRELIVNAVMHRNYLAPSYIQVCIYDDRLEITSPGGLYGGLTIEQMLKGSSSIRNELVADIFLKMGIVEKWGTGIKRIRDLCKAHGLGEVLYSADDFSFTATIMRTRKDLFAPVPENITKTSPQFPNNGETAQGFPNNDETAQNFPNKLPDVFPNNLSEAIWETFGLIKNNPNITNEDLGKALGITDRAVRNHISVLKEAGLIAREGSKKSGHWIVLSQN